MDGSNEKLSEPNELKLKQYTCDLSQIKLMFDPLIVLTSQKTVVLEVDVGGGGCGGSMNMTLN